MPESEPGRGQGGARPPGREHDITRIDISPLEVELTEPFSISAGEAAVARSVLVKVTLNGGTFGYGEAAPFEAITGESQESTIDALRSVSAELVGLDASQWRTLAARLRAAIPTAPAARCAVEQAAIDAFTRHLGISLSAFFGGPSTDLVTDITIVAGDIPHSVESALRALEAGFKVVKVKIAAGGWETDVARLVAISDAAPELAIMVDANAGYSRAEAREFMRNAIAANVKLTLVEQPVSADDITGLAALEQEFGVPVCADESVRTPADAIQVVRTGGISAINVKLMKSGVADALDIVSVARSAGISCMIGGMVETSLSMTFSAFLAAANLSLFPHIDLDTPLFMPEGLIRNGIRYSGPLISVPDDAVGTGIDASLHFPADGAS